MLVSFPRQIINSSEPEILHFITACNKNSCQPILSDDIIPKATEVAITILNTSENSVYASVKLKNEEGNTKLLQLIGPQQTGQFCFETLGDCTLGDFELRVAKKANKEVSNFSEKDKPSLKRKMKDLEAIESEKEKEKEISPQESGSKRTKVDADISTSKALGENGVQKQFFLGTCLWDCDSESQIPWGQEVLEGRKLKVIVQNPNESAIQIFCGAFRVDKTRLPTKGLNMAFLDKHESKKLFTLVPKEEDKIVTLVFSYFEISNQAKQKPHEFIMFIPIIANKEEIRTA